ncbi:DUF2271 domain-containing protein [Weeksella virosa]|uniref:DUF2271 domain-containing protein n=1 Tax=Weeksella virosa TaxID=1014 RepID=UPI000E01234D|nr:DUF2271 domain-containing protein [Weeksella virosa]MDK7674971.1 DUF2271 domain-containing protein [Weeksella virosa]SUP53306.1 Predicted periplasmic protein (DUF2271) [Weeksella virosa]
MKKSIQLLAYSFFMLLFAQLSFGQTTKYKTMIQMQHYTGKEAYIIISLIDPKGNYEKTLGVLGPDQEWYNTLLEWDKFRVKKKENLNAITGASVAGGARATRVIEFDTAKLDKGYTLRFESAVETQKYHVKDAEVPLTTAALSNKAGVNGKGYIKQVRFIKVQ